MKTQRKNRCIIRTKLLYFGFHNHRLIRNFQRAKKSSGRKMEGQCLHAQQKTRKTQNESQNLVFVDYTILDIVHTKESANKIKYLTWTVSRHFTLSHKFYGFQEWKLIVWKKGSGKKLSHLDLEKLCKTNLVTVILIYCYISVGSITYFAWGKKDE